MDRAQESRSSRPAGRSLPARLLSASWPDEAAGNGLLDAQAAAGIRSIRGPRRLGRRLGNWLGIREAEALICAPGADTLKGLRDQASLCVAIGCGLRRGEIARLTTEHFQLRNGRWLIVDLMGKHRRIRTVPVPDWVKRFVDAWLERSRIRSGRVFPAVDKAGRMSGPSLAPQAVYEVARTYGYRAGLRMARTICAALSRMSREGGSSIEQIQHSLGHSSLTTTERYPGLAQDLSSAPGDYIRLNIEPKPASASADKQAFGAVLDRFRVKDIGAHAL